MNLQIEQGEALSVLRTLPDALVQTTITSPPYFALRDYGTATWEGGDAACDHQPDKEWVQRMFMAKNTANSTPKQSDGKDHTQVAAARMRWYKQTPGKCPRCGATKIDLQLGLESTPEEYVTRLVAIMREVKRVLKDDGTLWLNIGDTYAGGGRGNYGENINNGEGQYTDRSAFKYPGIKSKDLVGIPWLVAFALRSDGWWLRQEIVWHKPAPMPESVTDRCTRSHESLFLLAKSANYYFDAAAIAEPSADGTRNKRDVWSIQTEPYRDAHFACVDESTECLTQSGWRSYRELSIGTRIAAYDDADKRLKWQRVQRVAAYHYNGPMYVLGRRDMGFVVTPNHRCLVRTRGGKGRVLRADMLRPTMEIPTIAQWDRNTYGASDDPGPKMASLLGWIVTEGTMEEYAIRIYQSHSANPRHVNAIRCLLSSLGINHKETWRTRMARLPNGKMSKVTTEVAFGIRVNDVRRISRLIPEKKPLWSSLAWSEASLRAMWEAMIDGDGSRRGGRSIFVQRDRYIAEWFQALTVRLGMRAIMSHRANSHHGVYTVFVTRKKWHSLRGTNGKGSGISTRRYRGMIWCPKVASGLWLARRNGRIIITGNTMPQDLVGPCVLAGSKVGDLVLDPFAGSGTVGVVALRHGRRFRGIDLNATYVDMANCRVAGPLFANLPDEPDLEVEEQ